MTAWKRSNVGEMRLGCLAGLSIMALLAVGTAWSQSAGPIWDSGTPLPQTPIWPVYVVPGEPEISTLYADGSQILVETEERWKLMCGSDPTGVTAEDLRINTEKHYASQREGPIIVVDSGPRTSGINIVFNADGSVPPGALGGLALAEAYIESQFADPITVTIAVSFANLGDPNIIGQTASNFVNGVSYVNSRDGLINGMDSDDVIQVWLPTGSTCPVRFNGGSDTVSQQSYINWTRANYKATVGSVSGNAASMQFNTQMTFDYNPADGVNGMSFVDVCIHETGHALGFVSATDYGSYMDALDLYRFQRTDGAYDYNPDTYEEFQVRPRLVSYNSPDDDHNSDLIVVEYRMSDGNPWQASHFREQSPRIGIMAPTFSSGLTYYPNYFFTADINMFDAIGYDYPPCVVPQFLQHPQNQNGCLGGSVSMSVQVDIPQPGYQWRIGTTNLSDNGKYSGTHTNTLTIYNLDPNDVSPYYNCKVTNLADGCVAASNFATVGVYTPVTITDQPDDKTVTEYANVTLQVSATGQEPIEYRWRRNGVPLQNVGNIYGATSPTLVILAIEASQAGCFDVQVTNLCGTVTSDAAQVIVNTGYGAGRADLNCDNAVGFADINAFVLALTSGEDGYYDRYPDCHWYNADMNSDGVVGFSDINLFVQCMTSGNCSPPPCP